MQDFSLTTGKTLTELTALTQDTVCGDFNYNAENHLLYEKEWHSIDPNGVIKPSDTQHYFYKDQQLKTDPKYCGKLYWKMCAQVWTSDIASTQIIADDFQGTNTNNYNSAIFNSTNPLLDLVMKGYKKYRESGNIFMLSKKIDGILGTDVIKSNFSLIKGLQTAKPIPDYSYSFYYSSSAIPPNKEYFILATPNSFGYGLFGSWTGEGYTNNLTPIKVQGGDSNIITIDYSQAENNTDSEAFYSISISPDYTDQSKKPQALPLGIGIYAGITTKNSITSTTSSKIIPFMCYCIGITETPTEA